MYAASSLGRNGQVFHDVLREAWASQLNARSHRVKVLQLRYPERVGEELVLTPENMSGLIGLSPSFVR